MTPAELKAARTRLRLSQPALAKRRRRNVKRTAVLTSSHMTTRQRLATLRAALEELRANPLHDRFVRETERTLDWLDRFFQTGDHDDDR